METMKVEVETNDEGREDVVELEGDDWGHERDGRDHTDFSDKTLPLGWKKFILLVDKALK